MADDKNPTPSPETAAQRSARVAENMAYARRLRAMLGHPPTGRIFQPPTDRPRPKLTPEQQKRFDKAIGRSTPTDDQSP